MRGARARNESGIVRGVVGLAVIGVIAVGIAVAVRTGFGPLPDPDRCTLRVGTEKVGFDTEQSENAALIAAIGIRRGLPARAVSIALAAAMQESKLRNINRGDRDSLGLFQQRPSQGWGTPSQILDPAYATRRFYRALEQVDGYETMSIAAAAQAVQRSAYPDAYAKHEPVARALASALTGYTPEDFDCSVRAVSDLPSEPVGANGLTPRATAVRKDVRSAFGRDVIRRFGKDGTALRIVVAPAGSETRRLGAAIASYVVARASLLDVQSVAHAGRVWIRDGNGWRDGDAGTGQVGVTVVE